MTPEIYRRVCEARPELRVGGSDCYLRYSWVDDVFGAAWYWCACDNVPSSQRIVTEDTAHAMILAHWENMLPMHHAVFEFSKGQFVVVKLLGDTWEEIGLVGSSRFHALAEFHVPGSTKGTGDE